ncbi:hypothetical protein [Stenotrophomonas sp.]|uniref:hypothetical protein n=1 Tax=Stenotrophomonas sp. TaxID=69392 RepID=UPI002FCB1947
MKSKKVIVVAGVAAAVAIAGFCLLGGRMPDRDARVTPEPSRQPAEVSDVLPTERGALRNGPVERIARIDANRALQDFLTLKERAERGDPVAQRELSEQYGRCLPVNYNPHKYLGGVEAIAALDKDPANAARYRQAAKDQLDECAVVDGGDVVPLEARSLWLEQAAKAGDLVAEARVNRGPEMSYRGRQLEHFMDRVIASGDPLALFEMGQNLASADVGDVRRYADVAGSEMAFYAWGIAACDMGLPCDQGSEIMVSLCLNTTACSSPDFETWVRERLINADDAARLDRQVEQVKRLLPGKG